MWMFTSRQNIFKENSLKKDNLRANYNNKPKLIASINTNQPNLYF